MKYVILLAASQIADVLTTGIALSRGAFETNGIAAAIMNIGGLPLLALFKMLVVLVASLLILRSKEVRDSRFLGIIYGVIVFISAFTFAIAGFNIIVAVTV